MIYVRTHGVSNAAAKPVSCIYKCMPNESDANVYAFIVFTQGPGGRASGANVGGTGNMGTTNGNNPNGMDKTRTSQSNSAGDMSSSNRPGWFLYPSNSVKLTTNLGDIAVLTICMLAILLSSL